MFGFGKEKPGAAKVESKSEDKNTLLQKLRSLKFAIPAAMATFLASCEDADHRVLAEEDVRLEAFEKEETLPKVSKENIELVVNSYGDLKHKLEGTEDNFFKWGESNSAVIAENNNIRIYEGLENLTYEQLKNNPPSEAEKVGMSIAEREWSEGKKIEGKTYKQASGEWIGDEQTGHYEERDSVTIVVPDKVWQETRRAFMEASPATTYEFSFDEDEHTITLTWGDLAYESIERTSGYDFHFAKDREDGVFDDNILKQELGRMSVDTETGGIIYFYDTENTATAFQMREDGVVSLGSDVNGPKIAKEFFDMKVKDFERAKEEIAKRLR